MKLYVPNAGPKACDELCTKAFETRPYDFASSLNLYWVSLGFVDFSRKGASLTALSKRHSRRVNVNIEL